MTAVGFRYNKLEDQTAWTSIYIAAIISFIRSFMTSLYWGVLWPYLILLDNTTTEGYFGIVGTIANATQAVMTYLFGKLSRRIGGKCKLPLLLSILVSIVTNIIFLSVPYLPLPTSIVLTVTTVLLGMGSGVLSVLRNFSVVASTEADRSRSLSLNLLSFSAGLVVAPFAQILLALFGYPGLVIVGFSINTYTAPMILALMANIFSLFLLVNYFKESSIGVKIYPSEKDLESKNLKEEVQYDRLAFVVCLLTNCSLQYLVSNIESVSAVFSMSVFGWSKAETIVMGSVINFFYGTIQSLMYFIEFRMSFNNRIDGRKLIIAGFLLISLFYFCTFSWWFLPGQLIKNANNGTGEVIGCRETLEWCGDIKPVNSTIYIICYIVFLGFGFSLISNFLNPLYSAILGPIDQSTLSAYFLISSTCGKIATPYITLSLFEKYGPRPIWSSGFFTSLCSIVLWCICYKRMVPLRTN